jgi:hypothetical protein
MRVAVPDGVAVMRGRRLHASGRLADSCSAFDHAFDYAFDHTFDHTFDLGRRGRRGRRVLLRAARSVKRPGAFGAPYSTGWLRTI